MSSYESDTKRSYIYNFAAPAAVGGEVIGVEEATGLNALTPINDIDLLDAFISSAAAAGVELRFFLRKPGKNDTLIGDQNRLRPSVNVERRPGYPLGLAPGLFQIVMRQTAGALSAQTLTLVFDSDLVL